MSSPTLITGATGFIGTQLTRDLLAMGRPVRVLARNPAKALELFGRGAEICPGDLTDPEAVARACDHVSTIYHIGGIYRFGLRHRPELWRTNVEGTENLMQAAARSGVGKIVHLSSGSLLKKEKPGHENSLLNENDFPDAPPPASAYKYTKWHAEKRALAWARRGLPVAIASTTCPIGAGDDGPTPTGQIVGDFLDRRFPFYCRTALNFISVADLSRGLQRVAAVGRPGERYLLSNENLWLKDFLDLLEAETGMPAPARCLPQWAIFLAGCGGEAFDYLNPRSRGARVCLETAVQAERLQFFSNARAVRELAWRPEVTIALAIREAVAWFRGRATLEIPVAEPAPVHLHVR